MFTKKKDSLTQKNDLFTYTKQTPKRQIPTANSHGKFSRQIAVANSHGKKPRQIAAANSHGKVKSGKVSNRFLMTKDLIVQK